MRTAALVTVLGFLYWALRRLLELFLLMGREERAKDGEILVLRHERRYCGGRSGARVCEHRTELCWRR